jgi:HAE1 family hydrophobic/amphiphilic exporter-1
MAVAVLGGLCSATVLTLIVIPVAYSVIEELRERVAQRRSANAIGSMPEPSLGD